MRVRHLTADPTSSIPTLRASGRHPTKRMGRPRSVGPQPCSHPFLGPRISRAENEPENVYLCTLPSTSRDLLQPVAHGQLGPLRCPRATRHSSREFDVSEVARNNRRYRADLRRQLRNRTEFQNGSRFRRDSSARGLAPWPRETGSQLSRYRHPRGQTMIST